MPTVFLRAFVLGATVLVAASTHAFEGKVVDAKTKQPLHGASVTVADQVARTDKDGRFTIDAAGDLIRVRAPGYKRQDFAASSLDQDPPELTLAPFQVNALYLSVFGIGDAKLRDGAIESLKANRMNSLVIDVKGDRGLIPFKVDIPLAAQVGAQKVITVKDMPALLSKLREQGIYLIARIVVFKDDPLAGAKPEWAVSMKRGGPFRDREKLRWMDPFRKEVWDYNIAIAKAAAEAGFDEIQFDYVRFPDNKGTVFSQPATEESRTRTITGFLQAAHKALVPYNVVVAADIFGYVLWNTNDTDIGQKIEPIMEAVDVVAPMLYPSGFQDGIPKYRNPVQHPYEVVLLSLKHARERTSTTPNRFRPWLQAFRDYAFGGKAFNEQEMKTQVKAAEDFGAWGWMFWNPRNVYPKKFLD